MSEGLSEEDALKKMLEMTEEEKSEIVEMNAVVTTPVKQYDGKIMPNKERWWKTSVSKTKERTGLRTLSKLSTGRSQDLPFFV